MSVIALAVLLACTIGYIAQAFFNKLFSLSCDQPSATATPVFAFISGIICGIANLVTADFHFSASLITWIFGLSNGVILFLFKLATVNAARTGPYSFQSLLSTSGNILLPLFYCILLCREPFGWMDITGIALMFVSFLFFNLKGLNFSGLKKGYFFWVILLFLTNGVYGVLMDAQQRTSAGMEKDEMIIITFVSSAIISILLLLYHKGRNLPESFRLGKKAWIYVITASLVGVAAVNFLMVGIREIPSGIFYTMLNGSVLCGNVLLGLFFFHEKMDPFKWIGLAVAVLSLVLLGI